MGAEFGMTETVLSLFLAGLFGVTGYMVGYGIALRGQQIMVLGIVAVSAVIWAGVIFVADYPHLLAASKAALIANATLWPLSLGSLAGFLIHQRDRVQRSSQKRELR